MKKVYISFVLITLSVVFLYPVTVSAYEGGVRDNFVSPNKSVDLKTQFLFGNITNMGDLTTRFWPVAFGVAGVVLTLYTLIGAFKFIMSGGDKESVANARRMITHAIVGFMLLILLFLIFQYLPKALGFDFAVFKR